MKTPFFLIALAACSVAPPETFAIDPSTPAAQAAVVRDVAQAWCEARGFCPDEVAWADADGRVFWSPEYSAYDRNAASCAYTERAEATIRINAERPECAADLHVFWLVVAHEFGHLSGLDGHGHGLAIMAAELDPTLELEIR